MNRKFHSGALAALCALTLLGGCAAKTPDAAAKSEPAQSASVQSDPAQSAPQSGPVVDPAYQTIIDRYAQAIADGSDSEAMMDQGLNYMVADAEKNGASTVGYLVEDVNDDGSPELVIAAEADDKFYRGLIFDFYTLEDGQAVQQFTSAERDRWYYAGTNRVLNVGSSSAWQTFWYLSTSDHEMAFVNCVEYDYLQNPDDPWLEFTGETWQSLPEDDAEIKVDEIEAAVCPLPGLTAFDAA